jgi:hypothetical protein
MTTQSYGIAKLHLIFNFMALINMTIHVILWFIGINAFDSKTAIVIEIIDLLVKIGIVVIGKKILSINIKLNKLN